MNRLGVIGLAGVLKKIDQFFSNINQILEYLSQLFQNGLQYRTINNYRSVIYAFHVITFKGSQWEKPQSLLF